MLPTRRLVCGLLLAALAAPLLAEAPEPRFDFSPAAVVATVDGESLTLGELLVRFATLPQPQRDRYAARREGLKDFLVDTVANLLVAGEAQRLGAEQDPLYETLLKIRREEVLRDLYARRTVLAEIDEAAVEARYEARKELVFRRRPLVRARHILVTPVAEHLPPNESGDDAVGDQASRAKIEKIHRQLTAGTDFGALARRQSEDASAADGGDLGWVEQDDLVPELSKAVFSLPVGETSSVIESELGLHIAQVVERRAGGVVPYDLVRELLFQELVGERALYFAREARDGRDRLVGEHSVEIFSERLPW